MLATITSRRLAGPLLTALAVLAATGCGSPSGKPATSIQTLSFKLTDAGCSPRAATAKAGPVTIAVENGGSTRVTELELRTPAGIILGEQEHVVGKWSGSFSLNLEPGRYTLNCPNGTQESGTLTVTGSPTAAAHGPSALELALATAGYKRYVIQEAGELLASTRDFVAALRAGDLQKARTLYGPTRYHYEAIEPVAESFGQLDADIDARENDVPASRWTGFHHIEQYLWVRNTTAGTGPLATRLLADVTTLDTRVQTLVYQAPQLANGAVELLNEVASSKITGEEDRYSHTDLSDFAANVAGAQKAFELLSPALMQLGQKGLVTTIDARFAAVVHGLDRFRRPTPLGYALYSAVTPDDRRTFAAQIDALAEPLSTVAGMVTVG